MPSDYTGTRLYELLQAGLDHIDQGITIVDGDLRLVSWNRKFVELLDFPDSMARVGTPFEAFMRFNAERGEYGPGEVEDLVAKRVAAARTFSPHTFERTRPNGRIIAIHGSPLPGAGFVTVYTDVTEQRLAEQQIRGEVVELESRLRLITDTVPALIAYVDRDQRYQFANKGYAEWFGYSKSDIIGRPVAEVVGERLFCFIEGHLRAALAGNRVSYEYALESPDGHTAYARSTLVPERTQSGEVIGLFVLSLDITEQKKAEAALVQAQKMEAVGQLTGGLAHDFNNLLTIIIGNLAAAHGRPGAEAVAEFIDPALDAARRGAELTRRLLAFSRRQPLEPEIVEVDGLVANMVGLMRRSLSSRIEISLVARGCELYARVDPHQLENALLNLALNARDAMPTGGQLRIETATVTVHGTEGFDTTVPTGDYVQILVADSGSGMDAETQARAFEPFFTRKEFGVGSGLGLSMVYGFVKQSGGYIRLRSVPGAGTTVTVLLPAERPSPSQPRAETEMPPPAGERAGRLILLVEDDTAVRQLLRRQLTALGNLVLEAPNGAEGVRLIDTIPDIALLVTDIVMPGGMDGLTLARLARQRRPELGVILVSGYPDAAGPETDADGTPFPLLRKPFEEAELAALVGA